MHHQPPLDTRGGGDDHVLQINPLAPRMSNPPDNHLELSASDNHDISLDSRRLQSQHTTTGYREGITAGKAVSIQPGFDQGYPLGASLGLRAGQLLGHLESIATALAGTSHHDHIDRLVSEAAAELSPERLFTPEYWAPDGTCTYPIVQGAGLAGSHPFIRKWSQVVDGEARRWKIDLDLSILSAEESLSQKETAVESASLPTASNRIDW
ncbi:hypothetical protein F5Y16DRAFT_389917 [Xylariaceae sp. FL0255]|nr:hypothetical protein F5Y16DRAFT_389917 [Xylariaceae sp. FL0255]